MINKEHRIMRPIIKGIALVIFLITILTACNMPFSPASDDDVDFAAVNPDASTGVSILYPVNGARFQVGDFVDVNSQIGDPSGVAAAILTANGQVLRRDQLISPVAGGQLYQPWVPNTPGTYELQVVLETSAGGQHISQPVTVIVEDVTSPPPVTDVPQTEAPPPVTESPVQTDISEKPQATANQNTNCRVGPGSAYGVAWSFLDGQTAPIVGRNENSTWLVVERLDGNGQCWVWADLISVQGNVSGLPVIPAPPQPVTATPEPTEPPATETVEPTEPPYTACHDYPDFGTCTSDPMGFGGCSWSTGLNKCEP